MVRFPDVTCQRAPSDRRYATLRVPALCGVLTALAVTLLPVGGALRRIELDQLVVGDRSAAPQGDPLVAIVGLDDAARRALASPSGKGLDRAGFARLLGAVRDLRPRVVAVDVVFADPSQPASDLELAVALGSCPGAVAGAAFRYQTDRLAPILRQPLPEILARDVAVGITNTHHDPDGVVRRITLIQNHDGKPRPHLALEAARRYFGSDAPEVAPDGLVLRCPPPLGSRRIPLDPATGAMLISYRGTHRFEVVPAGQLLGASALSPPARAAVRRSLEGKVVLVGATGVQSEDRNITPFGLRLGQAGLTPGVEILAHAVEGILTGDLLSEPPPAVRHGLVWAASMLGAGLCWALAPLASLAILVLLEVLVAVGALAAFRSGMLLGGLELGVALGLSSLSSLLCSRGRPSSSEALPDGILSSTTPVVLRPCVLVYLQSFDLEARVEGRPADEAVRWMNRFLECAGVIEEHGGTLAREGPFRAMAVFTSDGGQSDPARRALASTRDVLAALSGAGCPWAEPGPVRWHAGVHAGRAAIGSVGFARRRWWAAVGPDVVTASRLPEIAARFELPLLVTEGVVRATLADAAFRELDRVRTAAGVLVVHEPQARDAAGQDRLRTALLDYEAALHDYYRMAWGPARDRLFRVLEVMPGDGPTRALLERIETFQARPPPEGWAGEYPPA